jgi:Mg2+ and Co2+ transporter CorA
LKQIRLIEENGQQVPVDSRTLEPFRSRLQSLQSSQSNNNDSHSITITTSHTTSTTSNTSTDVFNVQPENDLVGINHHSHFASSDISHREQTSGKSLLWLSVFYPSQHTMNELQTLLNIHPLTIEDCLNSEECREKNEIFENYRFLVVNELHSSSQSTELVQTTVNILVFPHIIITIHQVSFFVSLSLSLSLPLNFFLSLL